MCWLVAAPSLSPNQFARIHETNLKKQGMLACTFAEASDYDRISPTDRLSLVDVDEFAPGKQLTLRVTPKEGDAFDLKLNHTYNAEQIQWFRAGSALNFLKSQQ